LGSGETALATGENTIAITRAIAIANPIAPSVLRRCIVAPFFPRPAICAGRPRGRLVDGTRLVY
jgi:hypothetical protein